MAVNETFDSLHLNWSWSYQPKLQNSFNFEAGVASFSKQLL